jgi:hypothetical protein
MKKHIFLALFLLVSVAVFAAEQTWENVSVIDSMCLSKVKENPDKHTMKCLAQCAGDGLGILTSDGTYLKFDDASNEKALAALKASDKKDAIRADITGVQEGDTITISQITIK